MQLSPEQDRGGPLLEEGNVLINAGRGLPGIADVPPPQNCVAKFLCEALQRPAVAQGMVAAARMDVPQYWEKRRVQNALRRLLEALQERLGLEDDPRAGGLGAAFDGLAQRCGPGAVGVGLDERQLSATLEALGAWPPELSATDHSEIFTALLVPSAAAVSAVLSGEPMGYTCTRQAFCEGLDRIPFNLPDFPVPLHLLSPALQPPLNKFTGEQISAAAEAVASTFSMGQTGLDRVKDFFLCGLVSVEEIQTALPRLVPHGLVEDAAVRVIRTSAPLLSAEEWQELVVTVRTQGAQACESTAAAACPGGSPAVAAKAAPAAAPAEEPAHWEVQGALSVSLMSPVAGHREVLPVGASAVVGALEANRDDPAGTPPAGSGPAEQEVPLLCFRGRFEPVTEPVPCRELRSEEPVSFLHADMEKDRLRSMRKPDEAPEAPPGPVRVVDWSTASRSPGVPLCGTRGSHQADEGAGLRLSWGTSCFKKELAAALSKYNAGEAGQAANDGPDYLAWVSLDLHHGCGGPFLARAFVRCCQLYERHKRQ